MDINKQLKDLLQEDDIKKLLTNNQFGSSIDINELLEKSGLDDEDMDTSDLNLNDELVEKITNGSLLSQNVAFMTHQELNPEGWKYLIEAKIKRYKTKFETNIEAATDTFTCRKCKSNKCTYYQMQTRSADEPMTTFVSCIECGNRWKC